MYKVEENTYPSYSGLEYDVIGHIPSEGVDTCKSLLFVGASEQIDYISENITDLNYHILVFKNYVSAFLWLESMESTPEKLPDAIICDLNSLEDEAYTFSSKLRKGKFLKTIPFVVVSKKHTMQDKIKALESGVDDFYSLPFYVTDLIQRITFLKEFKKEQRDSMLLRHKPFKRDISLSKRLFDIVFASIAIIALSPIFLIVILAILIENKGSVFYISRRVGTGYKIFNFYKFRSMVQDADKDLKKLAHLNQYNDKNKKDIFSGIAFVKISNDPRITPLGHILRKSSIDELPQLFNVLKGDMSIVGNRPLPLYEAEQLTKDVWAKRFLAPAGITGLWQVTKRGKENMSAEERINLDIAYASKASLLFDLKIIIKTFPSIWQKEAV